MKGSTDDWQTYHELHDQCWYPVKLDSGNTFRVRLTISTSTRNSGWSVSWQCPDGDHGGQHAGAFSHASMPS